MKYNWPLSISSFNLLDKVKIGFWLLTEDRWTQGEWVRKYEKKWEDRFGIKHAVLVSSGSTANELIALRRKFELQRLGQWATRNKVIFPSITWISSCSPWINLGFEPVFADVSANNMNMNLSDLQKVLQADIDNQIGTVFYTSLLGFHSDIEQIKKLCESKKIRFLLDNCESSFSDVKIGDKYVNINTITTCSTSIFFSHLTTSGTEGGLVFCDNREEYEWYLMARCHGMTRNMPEKYRNFDVDHMFDFYMMGSNYRSSNLQAYMALLDFDRAVNFCVNVDTRSRKSLAKLFANKLDANKYRIVHTTEELQHNCPFCLPIILKNNSPEKLFDIKEILADNKIEYRIIVGGNLLHQTAFKKFGSSKSFPNAEYLHYNGVYIGLHSGVNVEMINSITNKLNNL